MTRTPVDRAAVLRRSLAAIVAVDVVSFVFFLRDARVAALAAGSASPAFAELLSGPTVVGAVVLIGVAGAAGFSRRPGRLWEGLLALSALILLSTVHAQLFGSPWRHLYYSGVCLAGWLLGLMVSRRHGAPVDEAYACIGSTALLGAAYLNAGISKLVFGGTDWVSGLPIQAIVVAQDGLVADSVVSVYRSWVVATPAVASLFSVATLVFELAGPLMIVGRRTRRWVTLGLLAMHTNIYLLTHILYWQSMFYLVLFGLFADGPRPDAARDSTAVPRLSRRTFRVAAALLALCAGAAVVHQGWRYTQAEDARRAASGSGIPSTPSASGPRRVGPFTVGQRLAGGWLVEALTLSDEGFVAMLSGEAGRAGFEVSCGVSEHHSPFDVGPVHIFYSGDVAFPELEPVGRVLQEQVRRAADGEDGCRKVAEWRGAARAQPRQ